MFLFVYLFFLKGTQRNDKIKELFHRKHKSEKSVIHSGGKNKPVLHRGKQTVQILQAGFLRKRTWTSLMTDFDAMVENEFCTSKIQNTRMSAMRLTLKHACYKQDPNSGNITRHYCRRRKNLAGSHP